MPCSFILLGCHGMSLSLAWGRRTRKSVKLTHPCNCSQLCVQRQQFCEPRAFAKSVWDILLLLLLSHLPRSSRCRSSPELEQRQPNQRQELSACTLKHGTQLTSVHVEQATRARLSRQLMSCTAPGTEQFMPSVLLSKATKTT